MNRAFTLNHSQQAVVAALSHAGTLTRRAVCRRTKRSWAAISKAVSQLQSMGIVANIEEIDDTSRGRKPGIMRLNSHIHLVGISITPQQVTMLTTGLDGTVQGMANITLQPGDDPVATLLPHLRDKMACQQPTIALGIAFPGVIEADKQRVMLSVHFPDYRDRPLAEEIRIGLGLKELPVLVERNAVCALNSLQVRRRLDGDTLLISLVTGVSAAVYIDGQILHGHSGNIGELGHLPTDYGDHLPCTCGRRSCIETEIGGMAWQRKWRATCPPEATSISFRDAIRNGHPVAVKLLTDSLSALFPQLAHLIILLRPDHLAMVANLPASTQTIIAQALAPLWTEHHISSPPDLIFMPEEEGHTALGAAGLGLLHLSGTPCYQGE